MNRAVTKAIRESTGISLGQFCKDYLDSEFCAFQARLKKGKLYPNEAFLICLVTGKNPKELFGETAMEIFCIKGKESVNVRVRDLLNKPYAIDKVNIILNDNLKINLEVSKPEDRQPVKKVKRVIKEQQPPESVAPPIKKVDSDFDFVDDAMFK